MQVIIDTAETTITVKNKCFYIENKSIKRQISPRRISSMAITVNCTINASAIKLAANHQVPLLFFNTFGTIQARLWSPYFVNLANLRKKQLLFSMDERATKWIIDILHKKTNGQISNLRRLARQRPRHKDQVAQTISAMQTIIDKTAQIEPTIIKDVRGTLMGYEGSISRHYFKMLNAFLPDQFKFERRSRRPAMDYFNAGLNYLYGMTYSAVESGVFAKGLDPFIGFLHVDSYKKPTLVFDLIEPVRPVIDKLLVDLILAGELQPEHFIVKDQGYWMGKKGKRIVISSFNDFLQRRVSLNGSMRRIKDYIYDQSNTLGNIINTSFNLDDLPHHV